MTIQFSKGFLDKIVDQIRQDKPQKMYWDQGAQLSPAQINKILVLPDGYAEVSAQISESLGDYLQSIQMDRLRELLRRSSMAVAEELEIDESNLSDDLLDTIIFEYDLITFAPAVDIDLPWLLSNTRAKVVLQLDLFHRFEGWQWPATIQYDEVRAALKLFKINPRKVHPSFPDLKSREGNELISVADLTILWDNATNGGQYVVPLDLDLWEYHQHRNHFHAGIVLPKGGEIWMHDYFHGSGSVSVPLRDDLIILKSQLNYHFGEDSATVGHGLNKVYDLTSSAWSNRISPIQTNPETEQKLIPESQLVKDFMYGNVISALQFSAFIRAFHDCRTKYAGDRPLPGEMMEWDIVHSLWDDFPGAARKFLRMSANKAACHCAFKIREQIGQAELIHCQILVEDDSRQIVWYQINNSPRSRKFFRLINDRIERGQ